MRTGLAVVGVPAISNTLSSSIPNILHVSRTRRVILCFVLSYRNRTACRDVEARKELDSFSLA